MDGNHAPRTLHAELFEESGSDDSLAANEAVRVQKRAAEDRDDDNAEATTEHLRQVAHGGSTGHSAEIGDDLGDGDGVGGELVLVLQHGRVEILGAVGHEVEPGHQQDQVDEKKPMALESHLAFADEGLADGLAGCAHALAFNVAVGFSETQSECDDEDGDGCAKPERLIEISRRPCS